MRIWLASSNPGKLRDFAGLAPALEMELLPEFANLRPVVEDGDSFEANASKKAAEYSRASGRSDCVLADDSGLEVTALGGAPGIYSARFAGLGASDAANNALLLGRLAGIPEDRRQAAFVCVLAVARRGEVLARFHGRAEGTILAAPRGQFGFGYDPLFYSPAAGCGFGELTAQAKARFSHRGQAARALLAWAARQAADKPR
ncbi:MAG: non-canonical purine NTP pyrophosphatase [Terriglobales bacterium]